MRASTKAKVVFLSFLCGLVLGLPVAEAGGLGQIFAAVSQMFGGPVQATSATTGQALVKQSDGSWQGATVSANIQTLLDGISTTQGTVLYYNGTDWVALSPGTSGYFLKTQGAAANPTWAAAGALSGITNSTPGVLSWDTGSGAVTQILGPTDQVFTITAASAGSTSTGRKLALNGGPGGATSGQGGPVEIYGGIPTDGNGNYVAIGGSAGTGASRSGGDVYVDGGSPGASGNANGGSVYITAANKRGSGTSGNIVASCSGDGSITLKTSNATRATVADGGVTLATHLLFTDATFDIGQSGATRPRNIYASGTGTFGGAVSTGILTCTGFQTALTTKTADYTATTADQVILVNSASTPTTITLYAASGNSGRRLVIKNLHATGTVTIDANASETIDGATTKTISTQYGSYTIVCDGSNWFIE